MTTREQIIAEARTWIGTRWVHQGRLKGVACDCVGVGICAPRTVGVFAPDFDIKGYAEYPEPQVMVKFLRLHMDPIGVGEATGADILLVRPRRLPQHLQLLTFDGTVIHAIDRKRGVREHRLDTVRYPIASAWRYRGLE